MVTRSIVRPWTGIVKFSQKLYVCSLADPPRPPGVGRGAGVFGRLDGIPPGAVPLVAAGGRTPNETRAQAAGRWLHARVLVTGPVVCAMQQGLDRGRRRAIADEDDVQIRLLVEVHGTVDSGNDPSGVVAKRAAAEEREKHAVVAMASAFTIAAHSVAS